jgi:hypothetical protein
MHWFQVNSGNASYEREKRMPTRAPAVLQTRECFVGCQLFEYMLCRYRSRIMTLSFVQPMPLLPRLAPDRHKALPPVWV